MEAVILIDWSLIVSDTELHSNKDWAVGLHSLLINDGSPFDVFLLNIAECFANNVKMT